MIAGADADVDEPCYVCGPLDLGEELRDSMAFDGRAGREDCGRISYLKETKGESG
jgi:hypothetical protein